MTTKHHQKSTATAPRRHLELFKGLRRVLAGVSLSRPRILSFGCSEGFECIDIADIIVDAKVFGCEIDPAALAEAQKRCLDRATIFASNHSNLLAHGPFDVIVAFNVLCSYPQTAGMNNISDVYSFSDFCDGIGLLHEMVSPGGFLAIYNGAYFFEDTPFSSQYRSVPIESWPRNGWIEKSLPSGQRATSVTFHYLGKNFSLREWKKWMKEPHNLKGFQNDPENFTYSHKWAESDSARACRDLSTTLWQKLG